MHTTHKYVRLEKYNMFIFFPFGIPHSQFKDFKPISAGYCIFKNNMVSCSGYSSALDLGMDPEDTQLATKQVYGIEAALDLLKNH